MELFNFMAFYEYCGFAFKTSSLIEEVNYTIYDQYIRKLRKIIQKLMSSNEFRITLIEYSKKLVLKRRSNLICQEFLTVFYFSMLSRITIKWSICIESFLFQMKSTIFGLCLLATIVTVCGFGSSDDRFIKKYAMMKVNKCNYKKYVVRLMLAAGGMLGRIEVSSFEVSDV